MKLWQSWVAETQPGKLLCFCPLAFSEVHLIVRAGDLSGTMSDYLIQRIHNAAALRCRLPFSIDLLILQRPMPSRQEPSPPNMFIQS